MLNKLDMVKKLEIEDIPVNIMSFRIYLLV